MATAPMRPKFVIRSVALITSVLQPQVQVDIPKKKVIAAVATMQEMAIASLRNKSFGAA